MAKPWSSHGPPNWFFLNNNQCAQGCSMPNFRVVASILTDIFNFVTHSVSKSVSQSVTESDVELCTWPEARGTAKNICRCLILEPWPKHCFRTERELGLSISFKE